MKQKTKIKERRRFIGFILLVTLPFNLFISLSLARIIKFPFGIVMGIFPVIQTIFTFEFLRRIDEEKEKKGGILKC